MPVKVTKRGEKYRVVEASTGKLVKNGAGTPADGGGHPNELGDYYLNWDLKYTSMGKERFL